MQTAPWSWGWGLPWGLPCLSPASLQLSALCIPPQSWHSGARAVFPFWPSRTAGKRRGDPGLADAPIAEHDAEEMRGSCCNFHCPL